MPDFSPISTAFWGFFRDLSYIFCLTFGELAAKVQRGFWEAFGARLGGAFVNIDSARCALGLTRDFVEKTKRLHKTIATDHKGVLFIFAILVTNTLVILYSSMES